MPVADHRMVDHGGAVQGDRAHAKETHSKRISAKNVLRLPDLDHSKTPVLQSLGSVASKRTYAIAINDFITWYCSEPRLAFGRTVVLRYRYELEARRLASATIDLMPAVFVAVLLRRIETQPHRQYLTLNHDARITHALVVIPKFGGKASVVVLVHEVYGLTEWANTARQEGEVVRRDCCALLFPERKSISDLGLESDRDGSGNTFHLV